MKGKILTQTTDGVEIVDALVDYPGALKSIIWGLRTSKEDKAAIRDLLKNVASCTNKRLEPAVNSGSQLR